MLISSDTDLRAVHATLFGVAHAARFSVFGPGGLQKFLKLNSISDFDPVYGNYALLRQVDGALEIRTDHFGLYRLFNYRSGDHWAVSDSVDALVQYARAKGLPLTPYPAAAYAFFLPGSLGHQLASFRTPIKEIQLLPHWQDLRIDSTGCHPLIKRPVAVAKELSEAIYEAGHFMSSLFQSYLANGLKPFLRLSAGLDSRCTLAAMICGLPPADRRLLVVWSSAAPIFASELPIAKSLASAVGASTSVGQPMQYWPAWPIWRHCFLGAQSHLGLYTRSTSCHPIFSGAGAETVKGMYDWKGSTDGLSWPDTIPLRARAQIEEDLLSAVSRFPVDQEVELFLEDKHYQMFRNRFHFGRVLNDSIFNYPPLALAMMRARTGRDDLRPFHRLLFELGGRALLDAPFDDEKKGHKGPVPNDWQVRQFSTSDFPQRAVYVDDQEPESNRDLAWVQINTATDARRTSQDFVGAFARDVMSAIDEIEHRELLSEQVLSLARRRLAAIDISASAFDPNSFRAPMAVLSLHLAIAGQGR